MTSANIGSLSQMKLQEQLEEECSSDLSESKIDTLSEDMRTLSPSVSDQDP